jgi:hypothetical protein
MIVVGSAAAKSDHPVTTCRVLVALVRTPQQHTCDIDSFCLNDFPPYPCTSSKLHL